MDVGELVLVVAAIVLVAFTLGASVAWRLEGRRPLVQSLWLVVARNLSTISWTLFILVALDPPTAFVAIDPFSWTIVKALPFAAALIVLPLEVRGVLRGRRTA